MALTPREVLEARGFRVSLARAAGGALPYEGREGVKLAGWWSLGVHVILFWLFVLGSLLHALWKVPIEEMPQEQDTLRVVLPELVEPELEKQEEEQKAYVRTTQNAREEEAPEQVDFESDRNTTAATETPSMAPGPALPSQEGVDRPGLELMDRKDVDGEEATDEAAPEVVAKMPVLPPEPKMEEEKVEEMKDPLPPQLPQPKAAEMEEEKVEVLEFGQKKLMERKELDLPKMIEPEPEVMKPEVVSKLSPQIREPQEMVPPQPETAKSDFVPFTRKTKIRGTLSNRGKAAFNAEETPKGKYQKEVYDAIAKVWHRKRRQHGDFVSYGNMVIVFELNGQGKVFGLQVKRADSNAIMRDFTLQSVREAAIPPMPAELRGELNEEYMEFSFDVLIY